MYAGLLPNMGCLLYIEARPPAKGSPTLISKIAFPPKSSLMSVKVELWLNYIYWPFTTITTFVGSFSSVNYLVLPEQVVMKDFPTQIAFILGFGMDSFVWFKE